MDHQPARDQHRGLCQVLFASWHLGWMSDRSWQIITYHDRSKMIQSKDVQLGRHQSLRQVSGHLGWYQGCGQKRSHRELTLQGDRDYSTGSIFKKKSTHWWSGDFVWRCKRIACASSGEDSSTWSSTEDPSRILIPVSLGVMKVTGVKTLGLREGHPVCFIDMQKCKHMCWYICCVVLFHGLVNAVLGTGQSKWCGNVWKLLCLLLEGLDLCLASSM